MTGNNYQRLAMRTATGKCFDPANAALGLTGEAADEVKKCRDMLGEEEEE